jgi:3-dehydroquinate dehydratase-2
MNNKIYIINGPNINLVGVREPDLYGDISFDNYLIKLKQDVLFKSINILCKQTNSESDIITFLHNIGFQDNVLGIILNAGAYSHTSLAIHDAIKSIKNIVVEVHITNIYAREKIRRNSVLSLACKGVIAGFGLFSYKLAILSLIK